MHKNANGNSSGDESTKNNNKNSPGDESTKNNHPTTSIMQYAGEGVGQRQQLEVMERRGRKAFWTK